MAVYRKLNTGEELPNRIQDNTQKAINQISNNVLTSGTILTEIKLSSGDNTINHKLNKKLSGWFIVRQRGPATVYDKQDGNSSSDKTLILNSSASVSVDIYVF